jgi:DNA-binding NarL/FixJ family response regulator
MKQITVLIADDHDLFREGLRMLLAQDRGIMVVGEATDGLQALSLTESLQPDILLLDVRMPELGGLEALPKIRATCPMTKVLILSGFPEDELIARALELGAKGYLLKTLTHKDLLKAIRATHAGELWAERKVLASVFETMLHSRLNGPSLRLPDLRERLTEREQQIVKYVIQGMMNKEVATHLGISDATVKTHLSNIFRKLKVSRRLQLLLRQITERTD